MENCDGNSVGSCEKCKQHFKNKHVLYRHRKACDGTVRSGNNALTVPAAPMVQNITINIHNDNSTTTTNNVLNNVLTNIANMNVMTFPAEEDGNFDFVTKNITQGIMKNCVSANRAEVGFNRFMGAILDNPQNMFVRKSNPNVNYSKVHMGNGEWILAPDDDVYPLMTHHMTTAALAKLEEFSKSMRYICDNFQRYVNVVNTDDECKEYHDTIQRLKLMVVNMTKKIEAAEQDARIQALNNGHPQ